MWCNFTFYLTPLHIVFRYPILKQRGACYEEKKNVNIYLFCFGSSIIIVAVVLLLPCNHRWTDATCTVAKTCSKCEETEGAPLGHSWNEADCENPKTCSLCKKSDGEPLGHTWTDATCENPEICSQCQKTEGEPADHRWQQATCQHPKRCYVCGETEGYASGHSYKPDYSFGGYNCCIYCNEYEPNVVCPKCGWGLFTTGVGADGITCSDCGHKII